MNKFYKWLEKNIRYRWIILFLFASVGMVTKALDSPILMLISGIVIGFFGCLFLIVELEIREEKKEEM